MKRQQFRMKLIALLLMGMILIAGLHGVNTLPESGTSASLRDAILRLTGQASASPAPSDTPDPTPNSADATPGGTPESAPEASPAPIPAAVPMAESSSLPSAVQESSSAPSDTTPQLPLSEALSNYFSTEQKGSDDP